MHGSSWWSRAAPIPRSTTQCARRACDSARGSVLVLRPCSIGPRIAQDQLEDLISIVFGQLEALALERVLFAPGEIDPPEFVRGLETAKRVSAAMVRELD